MQVKLGRLARALLVTVLLTMSAIAAVPASAGTAPATPDAAPVPEPGPYFIQNLATGRCLDVDQGTPAWITCNSTDRGQRWIVWNGGFTKNIATGTCLRGKDHNVGGLSYTVGLASCDTADDNQYWRHWSGGWFQNIRSNACLDYFRDPATGFPGILTSPCAHVNAQFWWVQLW